jgi:glycerol kinase
VLAGGAAVQWLRDGLGLIADVDEAEQLARSVATSDGVVFVPALAGLGSPHWRPDARGLLAGLTRATTRAHVVRATLESIALQVADVLAAFPGELDVLRADGGASTNAFLMQLQAELLGCPVEVAAEAEATALGAAALGGLAVGSWTLDDLRTFPRPVTRYEPAGDPIELEQLRASWDAAVRRTLLD